MKRAYKIARNVLVVLAIACLLGWQAQPAVTWFVNNANAGRMNSYDEAAGKMGADTAQMLADAHEYNDWLRTHVPRIVDADLSQIGSEAHTDEFQRYQSMLHPGGIGVMAHLNIPSISAALPIVHGTTAEALMASAGHLYGSSLPVGDLDGGGTHTVIGAHSGWDKATLFNNLRDVKEGDTFVITTLGQRLAYKVIQIDVVEPGGASDLLQIINGKDYVTLATCFPTFINTHRLLVRGERLPDESQEARTALSAPRPGAGFPWWAAIVVGGSAVTLTLAYAPMGRKKTTRNESSS